KILDFGLARALAEQAQLTQQGAVVGTPAYMAPEQALGQPVDERSDLFSLGCVLYRMATGRTAFRGMDTMSILAAIALEKPVPPGELNAESPQELSDLILRLLAKDAKDRPGSAHEVATALRNLAEGDAGTEQQSGKQRSAAGRQAGMETTTDLPKRGGRK